MFRSLSPGAIGAKVENIADGLDLAARHGFAGYHFNIGEVADMGAEKAFAFPVDFRGEEAAFNMRASHE